MTEPPPPCFILGRQKRVHSQVVVRLASITLVQSAKVTVSGVPGGPVFTDPATGHYQVSVASGASYTLHVTDTTTGTVKNYSNAFGNVCGRADTAAF